MSNSLQPQGLYSLWHCPGQNTGVGSFSLLQGILPTQDQTQVSRIAGRFFTSWATREALAARGIPECLFCHLLSTGTELGLLWWLGGKESACRAGDAEGAGLILGLGRSPGGGHGNPLQYSCLDNPMDRGAWQTTVLGDAKSQTQLKWLSTHARPWIIWDEVYHLCLIPVI